MKSSALTFSNTPRNGEIYARQIAFCAAFLLPVGKFLEAPSILSQYAKGDILLPAILQFLVESLALLGVLYAASKSPKTLLERLTEKIGKWIIPVFILYGLYFLIAAILPLLDMEKFVYAAFFDTAPTTFAFGTFFFLTAFFCTKGIKAVGRCADLCLFLFLLPFLALITMSLFEADFSHLLPFFGTDVKGVSQAYTRTTPYFSDSVLLLPLVMNLRYEEGDGVKIMAGYWAGAVATLLFFAVFFGVFSTIAPREHYAFLKIAQYFPALDVIGRVDLLFVYLLTVVLLFYTCLPLFYTVACAARLAGTDRKTLFSGILTIASLLFVLFANRRYNLFYDFVSVRLAPVFWLLADVLPLCLLLLPREDSMRKRTGKEALRA